jgi:hypothetical protein
VNDPGPPPPLPPDLESLFAQAREPEPLPPDVSARMLERIDRRVALAGTEAEPRRGWRRWWRSPWALGALTFALGCAAGAMLERWRHPPRSPRVEVRERVVERVVRVTVAAPTPRVEAPAPEAPRPVVDAGAPPHTHERDDDLAGEQRVLDEALGAFGGGAHERALETIDRHTRRYPRGQLAPERESLRVRCLAALGRDDEARAAGERYLRRYGSTVFAAGVERALRRLGRDGGP